MFSYSVDVDIDEVELFLADLAETSSGYSQENDNSNEERQIAEELSALSMDDRLILPIEVDTEGDNDAPRLALVVHRSGPSVFTLLVLSEDEDLLHEVTATIRRLLALRERAPAEDQPPQED